MSDSMIISGTGAYTDPWHPFAETSSRLAELISSAGHQVALADDVEESLLRSGSVELLVINIGNPQPPRPASVMIDIQQSLLDHLERGGGLLGMHVSATSFTTMPRWAEILGGHWVRGTTMHPPLGPAVINVRTGAHSITDGLAAIEVVDERYCFLEVNDDVTVLGDHEQDGVVHPMIWARQQGAGRVVYDGLGHDVRSYQSEGHRQLLQRAVAWLLAG